MAQWEDKLQTASQAHAEAVADLEKIREEIRIEGPSAVRTYLQNEREQAVERRREDVSDCSRAILKRDTPRQGRTKRRRRVHIRL